MGFLSPSCMSCVACRTYSKLPSFVHCATKPDNQMYGQPFKALADVLNHKEERCL